jgi:hypothetical protein
VGLDTEEILMLISEDKGTNDMLFLQQSASMFAEGHEKLIKSEVSRQMDLQGQAHFLVVSSHDLTPLDIFFGGTYHLILWWEDKS